MKTRKETPHAKSYFTPFPLVPRDDEYKHAARVRANKVLDEITKLERLLESITDDRFKLDPNESRNARDGYLKLVEQGDQIERLIGKLHEERLDLVLKAGGAYDADFRGEHFPYRDLDERLDEFIDSSNRRLTANSSIAVFGAGLTFTTIFSATRGSLGLISLSWSAFAIAISICTVQQMFSKPCPRSKFVVHPGKRVNMGFLTTAASVANVAGIIIMGVALALLNTDDPSKVSSPDTRINAIIGGILSLVPVGLVFILAGYGFSWNFFWKSSYGVSIENSWKSSYGVTIENSLK